MTEQTDPQTLADVTALFVPTDAISAAVALAWCEVHLGGGFHPDTRGADYVEADGTTPTFTDAQAEHLDRVVDAIFAHTEGDVYGMSIDLMHVVRGTTPDGEADGDNGAVIDTEVACPGCDQHITVVTGDGECYTECGGEGEGGCNGWIEEGQRGPADAAHALAMAVAVAHLAGHIEGLAVPASAAEISAPVPDPTPVTVTVPAAMWRTLLGLREDFAEMVEHGDIDATDDRMVALNHLITLDPTTGTTTREA